MPEIRVRRHAKPLTATAFFRSVLAAQSVLLADEKARSNWAVTQRKSRQDAGSGPGYGMATGPRAVRPPTARALAAVARDSVSGSLRAVAPAEPRTRRASVTSA